MGNQTPTTTQSIDQQQTPPPPDGAERRFIPWVLAGALALGFVVLALLCWEFGMLFSVGAMWGLALYALGILLGFMFGIPRVVEPAPSDEGKPTPEQAAAEGLQPGQPLSQKAPLRRSSVNSNLVEVSDWLTKIIVGVGLVELKTLPGHGEALANFMADGLVTDTNKIGAAPVAGAIALYFSVLGFISGYLLTRVFLSVIMNLADREAARASGDVSLPGGTRVSITGALASVMTEISDLQNKVTGKTLGQGSQPPAPSPVFSPTSGSASSPAGPPSAFSAPNPPITSPSFAAAPQGAAGPQPAASSSVQPEVAGPPLFGEPPAAPVATPPPAAGEGLEMEPGVPREPSPPPGMPPGAPAVAGPPATVTPAVPPLAFRRVLWVDDNPGRNATLVDKLVSLGVEIVTARTTSEALAALANRPVSLLITDMHRKSEPRGAQPAGITLLQELRRRLPPVQAVVYCAPVSVKQYREQAQAEGAQLVTASPTDLLAYIGQVFGL